MSALDRIAEGPGKAEILELASKAIRDAAQKEGLSAWVSTRRLAAAHEVGHTIQTTAEGFQVVTGVEVYTKRFVREDMLGGIPSLTRRQENQFARSLVKMNSMPHWAGWTHYDTVTPPLDSATATVEAMAQQARECLAGYVGEMFFAREEVRAASSIDEVVLGQVFAANIAKRLGNEGLGQIIYGILLAEIHKTLDANRDVGRELIAALMKHRKIEGPALDPYLQIVKPFDVPAWPEVN